MIMILGLILLAAAAIVGVAAVLGNAGAEHALSDGFSVFGYDVTGSTGTLFLYGIVVGAVGAFGLSMLLAGARRTARRGGEARRGLKASRRETAAANEARDDLIGQREAVRAHEANTSSEAPGAGRRADPPDARGHGWRPFGRRPVAR